MGSAKSIIAVLDANVLYPAPVRDFLLRLAEVGLFIPKWSDEIQDEWTRSVLKNRPDLKAAQLARTCQFMEQAFEEANVKGYKTLMGELVLPDENDRHVLAVAIKSAASIIVTFNKKDFPSKRVKPYGVDIQDPDEFVLHLLKSNLLKVLRAFNILINALKNPPQTQEQLLTTLENSGLLKSVAMIRETLAR